MWHHRFCVKGAPFYLATVWQQLSLVSLHTKQVGNIDIKKLGSIFNTKIILVIK